MRAHSYILTNMEFEVYKEDVNTCNTCIQAQILRDKYEIHQAVIAESKHNHIFFLCYVNETVLS